MNPYQSPSMESFTSEQLAMEWSDGPLGWILIPIGLVWMLGLAIIIVPLFVVIIWPAIFLEKLWKRFSMK